LSWIGSVGAFFDLRFPVAGPGGFGFPGWGGVGGSYGPTRTSRGPYTAYLPAITTSPDLPGRTHWDPSATVSVGNAGGGGGSPDEGIVFTPGIGLPGVVISAALPDFVDEGQPPIIFDTAPIILPGQTDPGREEHEEEEMAHTWLHLGGQLLGGLFPDQNPMAYSPDNFTGGPAQGFVAAPGQVPVGGGTLETMAYSGGSCPPRKTRTLTIDCATGLEIKRTRRRRRKMLTEGDMAQLFQIATLPNNANVRTALARAVRR